MNYTAIALIGVALASQCLAGGAPRELRYRAYRATDAKAAKIVKILEGLSAKDLKIEDLPLSEAIHQLQKACAPREGTAVINFVIRYPKVQGREDPQGKQPEPEAPELRVTLRAETVDFAAAVDRMCRQVGYRWSIDVPESTGIPVLVIASDRG